MPSQPRETLERFFDAYLTQRDLEKSLSFLTEDVYSLGTGEHEIAADKQALAVLMREEFHESSEPVKYELLNYREKSLTPDVCASFCLVDLDTSDGAGGRLQFQTRLTVGFVRRDGDWKIGSIHMSAPSIHQPEREFLPLNYGRQDVVHMQESSQKKLLKLMSDVIPGGIMGGYMEDGFPLYVINDELLGYMGYTYRELMEDTGGKMAKIIHPDDLPLVEKQVWSGFRGPGEYQVQYRIRRKNGTYLWVYDKGRFITTEDGRAAMISIIMDISTSIELQKRLTKEATVDALTHLLNRREAVRRLEMDDGKGALMLIDIDDFKQLNDHLGHQVGDSVLVELGKILKENVRENDVAVRFGGDEFLVYLSHTDSESIARHKAELFCQLFARRTSQLYGKLGPTLSIGVVCSSEKMPFETWYARVDRAMYTAKRSGKSRVHVDVIK